MVVNEVNVALMRESDFIGKRHVTRNFAAEGAADFFLKGELLVFQHRILIDINVAIHRCDRLNGRQYRCLSRSAVHEVADRHQLVADTAIDWRQNPAPFQIQP
jgi:hypothetical protein